MKFLSYRRLMSCYKARHTRNMSPFTTSNALYIADHDIERLVMYLESIYFDHDNNSDDDDDDDSDDDDEDDDKNDGWSR